MTAVKWGAIVLVALLLMGLGAGVAWKWQANSYGKQLATQATAFQADLDKIAAAGAEQARVAVEHQQQAEQALTTLDAKSSKDKADAIAQNEALRASVASGARRLRVAGTCTASHSSGSVVPETPGTASVGNASTVELDSVAGQHIYDIRAGAIADQAALKALQDYVTNVCLK